MADMEAVRICISALRLIAQLGFSVFFIYLLSLDGAKHSKGNLTGLMPRWYVFPKIIWQFNSSSCSGVNPFIVPWVPTGMKIGVSTS